MTGQSINERIRFTNPQLTGLENSVEMTVEKLSHELIGLHIYIINPVISDHPCLIAWGNTKKKGQQSEKHLIGFFLLVICFFPSDATVTG